MMNLMPDWRRVLKKAWSVHLMAAASAVIIIQPLVGLLADMSHGWGLFISVGLHLLSGVFTLLAICARVIKQKDFEDGA